MTDWIKDNKFAAALLLVAILAVIGTFIFSAGKSKAFNAAKENFDTSASRLQTLEGRKPYPNEENLEERRKSVVEYRGKVEGLGNALLTFRPESFEKITPAEFTTRLNTVGETLKEKYTAEEIAFPEKWQTGFEVYTSSPPKDAATAFLNYQLGGLEWLYSQLAEAGPSELLNVHRPPLPVERGEPMVPTVEKRGRKPRQAAQTPQKPFFALPIELTFRGREASLRRLLGALADSKEYFFVVRSMRVQNVKYDTPPKSKDVEFEAPKPAEGIDLFGDFDFEDLPGEDGGSGEDATDGATDEGETPPDGEAPEGGEPEPEPEADAPGGERILGQVLGAEELHVFLQLELILFRDDVELPAVK